MTDSSQRLLAECYLEMHRGTPGDLAFYKTSCVGSAQVLELGVGGGRILSRLSAPVRVGLDNNPYMLELARERMGPDAELQLGDLASFSLGQRFDRVLLPYNGLLCVPRESQLACFVAARNHLTSNGEVLLDLYLGDELHEEASEVTSEPDQDEPEFLVEMSVGERQYRVFERSSWWPSQQRLDVCYTLSSVAGEHSLSLEIAHHYLLRQQLETLLREAGFTHTIWGELPGGDQVTIRARP